MFNISDFKFAIGIYLRGPDGPHLVRVDRISAVSPAKHGCDVHLEGGRALQVLEPAEAVCQKWFDGLEKGAGDAA